MRNKVNIDIGISPQGHGMRRMEAADAAELFPPRKHFSHKGDYGYIALMGGSFRYSGAVRLAAMAGAAMRAGAGVARLCAPRSLCRVMIPEILEVTLFPLAENDGDMVFREAEFREAIRGVRTVAFGMGAGLTAETEQAVRFLLEEYAGTLILDADGLNALAALLREEPGILKGAGGRVLLTPHPGEFARLTGKTVPEIQADGLNLAEAFAREHGVTVLLKGPATIVTDGRETWITDRGCPGMATAGSGDVLSGILAAVCAGDAPLPQTVAAGAWINGRAGELAQAEEGPVSMTAGDTVRAIPRAVREITESE
jgi:NAD(P)H-hydrate epimerase